MLIGKIHNNETNTTKIEISKSIISLQTQRYSFKTSLNSYAETILMMNYFSKSIIINAPLINSLNSFLNLIG